MKNRTNRSYSESFKFDVIQDYYASGISKRSIARKYDLSCVQLLSHWLKRYPIDSKELSLPQEVKAEYMDKTESETICQEELLKRRIAELEKALEYSNLRARSLEVLIDVAEENEGISIRKKPGAKQ